MANTSFLLPEETTELQPSILKPSTPEQITELIEEAKAIKATKVASYVDIRMQRAMEAMAEMENPEKSVEKPLKSHPERTPSRFAHVDIVALFWGLLAHFIFSGLALLVSGWASIFTYIQGSDPSIPALWFILLLQLVNVLCGSVTYRACYRDASVVRWDLNDHARYNVKISIGVLVALQLAFACLAPNFMTFLCLLLTPITVWLGAMRAEHLYNTGLNR
jgi:hypothetical protein